MVTLLFVVNGTYLHAIKDKDGKAVSCPSVSWVLIVIQLLCTLMRCSYEMM
jgi:hypothetical protein